MLAATLGNQNLGALSSWPRLWRLARRALAPDPLWPYARARAVLQAGVAFIRVCCLLAPQAQAAMTEERFVKIVEDDLQRVGHWVMQQSESLHAELGKLLTNCSNESYTLDSLRGEYQRAPWVPRLPYGRELRAEVCLAAAAPAEQADELGKMTCELDKLILLNYEVCCLRTGAHAPLRASSLFVAALCPHPDWTGSFGCCRASSRSQRNTTNGSACPRAPGCLPACPRPRSSTSALIRRGVAICAMPGCCAACCTCGASALLGGAAWRASSGQASLRALTHDVFRAAADCVGSE